MHICTAHTSACGNWYMSRCCVKMCTCMHCSPWPKVLLFYLVVLFRMMTVMYILSEYKHEHSFNSNVCVWLPIPQPVGWAYFVVLWWCRWEMFRLKMSMLSRYIPYFFHTTMLKTIRLPQQFSSTNTLVFHSYWRFIMKFGSIWKWPEDVAVAIHTFLCSNSFVSPCEVPWCTPLETFREWSVRCL